MDEQPVIGGLTFRQCLILAFAASGRDAKEILADVQAVVAHEERHRDRPALKFGRQQHGDEEDQAHAG